MQNRFSSVPYDNPPSSSVSSPALPKPVRSGPFALRLLPIVLLLILALIATTPLVAQGEGGVVPCVDGSAGGFPCRSIDLLARVSTTGNGTVRAVETWTDPVDGTEYAMVLVTIGTLFYDISDPTNPILVAKMRYALGCCVSYATDVAIYDDHAFIVGFQGEKGREMQVFDLARLRDVTTPPVDFEHDAIYSGFESASKVTANPDTGFLYTGRTDTCSNGMQMIDVTTPTSPTSAGCWDTSGAIDMAQCVVWRGPDPDYLDRELCFAANADALLILDVTDKTSPAIVSRTLYPESGRPIYGALTEDQTYFLLADSGDEYRVTHPTWTYLWDLSDLDAPTYAIHEAPSYARDQQNLVRGQFVYQANTLAGVRILDLHPIAEGRLDEIAFYDPIPNSDAPAYVVGSAFDIAVSGSGKVLMAGGKEEFLVLGPDLCTDPPAPGTPSVQATASNTLQVDWTGAPDTTFNVYRATGACPGVASEQVASQLATPSFVDTVAGQIEHAYVVTAVDASGRCESDFSVCASALATGPCNAPPIFDGIEQVDNPEANRCRTELSWNPATPRCGASVRYAVYRGDTADFEPSAANRIATALTGTTYVDHDVVHGEERHYIVRALDTFNGLADQNTRALAGSPVGSVASGPWTAGAEPGEAIFESNGDPIEWGIDTAIVQSGTASYHSGYQNLTCSALVTPPLRLTAGEAPMLTFWSRYDFAIRLDGGVVELSNDGGASWISRQPVGGYPWSFLSGNSCGYGSQHPAFTATDFTWEPYTFVLTPWAGQEILLRWVFAGSTNSPDFGGWWIDTIAVSHVDQSQACATLLFGDGFESGDTSLWSATMP